MDETHRAAYASPEKANAKAGLDCWRDVVLEISVEFLGRTTDIPRGRERNVSAL